MAQIEPCRDGRREPGGKGTYGGRREGRRLPIAARPMRVVGALHLYTEAAQKPAVGAGLVVRECRRCSSRKS